MQDTKQFNEYQAYSHPLADFHAIELSKAPSEFSISENCVELLPHHFTEPEICKRSVVVCHDLHAFDVPWKYSDAVHMQKTLTNVIDAANAVVTHFPRTFYRLEHVTGIQKVGLYLTQAPLMLNTNKLSDTRELSTEGRQVLLYPAQLQEHKNHITLFEALKILKRQRYDFELWLSGSEFSTKATEAITKSISDLNLADDVRVLGNIADDELLQLYRICDAVVVPSLAEGGAYVGLEAIAAGCPVMLSDIESARLHANSVGAVVEWSDPTDAKDMANKIERILDYGRTFCYRDNRNARRQLMMQTWDQVARQWVQIIEWVRGAGQRPITKVDPDGGNIELSPP